MSSVLEDMGVAGRILAALPEGGLFHEKNWRVALQPFVMPEGFYEELPKLGYRLQKFLRACDLLYLQSLRGKMPGWIAEVLEAGKPQGVIDLGRERIFRGEIPGVIRPDVIPVPGGYILSEIDSVPGGIGLTAWLNRAYSEEGFHVAGGPTGMLDGFASLLPDGGDIVISEEASAYRPEMEWLAGQLREKGIVCDVRDEWFCGPWKPVVYRFFELFDLPNLPCAGAMMDAAKAGMVRITAPPKAVLEEKLWFALFWARPLRDFWVREIGARTFEELQKCIPRTWLLDPSPLSPHAVYPGLDIQSWDELKRFSQKQRRLVIKVSGFSEFAWGGRGVTVGHDVSGEEWAAVIDRSLSGFSTSPCILQEFHAGEIFSVEALEPDARDIVKMQARVRLCPYFFTGGESLVLGGVLATACPADKKILHGMRDAAMAPVLAPF